jgi:hypothetical protein
VDNRKFVSGETILGRGIRSSKQNNVGVDARKWDQRNGCRCLLHSFTLLPSKCINMEPVATTLNKKTLCVRYCLLHKIEHRRQEQKRTSLVDRGPVAS